MRLKTKLNILIISQYFWPENFRINQLSTALLKKGNSVTVLTGLPNYPEGEIYKSYSEFPQNYSKYRGKINKSSSFTQGQK